MLYTDKDNPTAVYAEYPNANGSTVFASIDSSEFKDFLASLYCELAGETAYPKLGPYIRMKKAEASYKRVNPVTIAQRVHGSITQGKILYHLSDSTSRVVRVTEKSWDFIKKSKVVKFLCSVLEKKQVKPVRTNAGSLLDLLRPFVNLSDDEFLLFVVMLVQAFSRSSSHFAAVISAARGTGKTTLTRLFRRVVDPTVSEASLIPRNEEDLKVSLSKSYVASFDNTAKLTEKESNLLCAAITGSQEVKRKLYTDADTVVLNLHNVVLINGIDVVPDRDDLVERSLLFTPLEITPEKRKTDNDFWGTFDAALPAIEGAIMGTLSEAIAILPTLQVSELHRMADANLEMLAVAVALGEDADEFQRILLENNQKLQELYSNNSPVVEAVVEFMNGPMKKTNEVDQESGLAYIAIKDNYSGSPSLLPKSASWFTRELGRQDTALKAAGFKFWVEKKDKANHLHIVRL